MGRWDPVTEADAWWSRTPPAHPFGTCQCGCGARTDLAVKGHREKGWLAGQPRQYLKGHHTRLSGADWLEDENGCWVWQLGKTDDGYGCTFVDGRTRSAHRVYWEREHGPIPDGMTIDHLCRARHCVNPLHMEVVTLQENIARRWVTARGDG